MYSCKAFSAGGVEVSKDAELNIAKAALPLTPRFVLQVCLFQDVFMSCFSLIFDLFWMK